MITKDVPYAHLKQDVRVLLAIMNGELPSRPTAIDAEPSLSQLWDICTSCWETTPSIRIPIGQCVLLLEREIQVKQRSEWQTSLNQLEREDDSVPFLKPYSGQAR